MTLKLKIIAVLTVCILLLPRGLLAQNIVKLVPGDDLGAALSSASPGTLIELEAGDYGSFDAKKVSGSTSRPITVRSVDPSKPARISEMDLREINHLVLDGLLFDYTYSPVDKGNIRSFQIFASRDVTIRNSNFDGDVADSDGPEEESYPTGFGLSIVSSAEINIKNNSIHDFYRGMVVRDSVDVTVFGNDIYGIRMDGMNFAQVERVNIENNVIHDFKRAIDSADHSDMIQFWTNKTERPSVDITIRNNVLNSGLGLFTQSIFMRNEEVDQGRAGADMFYRNVTIENNVIINAQLHGIAIGETDGLIIRRNTVLHNARSDGRQENPTLRTPQVRVSARSKNVRAQSNVFHKFSGYENQFDWIVANNVEVQDKANTQPNSYNSLFVAAQSGDPRDLASFRYLSSGALAGAGVGAPMLDMESEFLIAPSQKELRAPVIRTTSDPDVPSRFIFDITQSSKELGLSFAENDAVWDFGDGQTATGLRVSHDYRLPGSVEVKLTIKISDGLSLNGTALVRPRNPEVIYFEAETGSVLSYASDPPTKLDLPLGAGPISLGGVNQLVAIPREAIAPFFGSRSFKLQTRIRSSGGYKSAGTFLHIYKTLVASVGGRGNITVNFSTETGSELKLSSAPSKVLNNEWVDIAIEYSDDDALLMLSANGEIVASGQISGPLRPLEHWGLVLGNPFRQGESFKGEMDELILKVGKDAR